MKILVITRIWSFIQDTINIWRSRGDTVFTSSFYDPVLAKKADIIFFEFIDPELSKATRCLIGSKKIIIARLHRIEYYMGMLAKLTRDGINWDAVNHLIITGDYFYKKIINGLEKKFIGNKCNILHLRYGIDENRYTFRKRDFTIATHGNFIIGWLAKNYDSRKNPIKAISAFKAIRNRYDQKICNFKLIMAAGGGDRGVDRYWEYLRSSQPEIHKHITKLRWQNDVNSFLEPMDYFLNTSINESFCFVIAEACLKGIKPLIWDFEPANTIWPREWTFFTDEEMFKIIEAPYESEKYRQYIIDNFSIKVQVKNFDKLMIK